MLNPSGTNSLVSLEDVVQCTTKALTVTSLTNSLPRTHSEQSHDGGETPLRQVSEARRGSSLWAGTGRYQVAHHQDTARARGVLTHIANNCCFLFL